ncbi:uncharacterized protein LOC135579367 [Columba livia]|uniref:uncharacterized protein LOC135579367 n=1 Tax=Columba livia TaxID=8932 RepID=UPI0031BBB2B8
MTPSMSPNAGLSSSVKRACNSEESLPTVNGRAPEDDHTPVGSPILLEEVESSPVHMLHLDGQSTAAVKGCLEGENLEDLETARDEQVDLLQGTERTAMSSVQKEKSFALMALAAPAPGTLGERYSASISQPLLAPVKDQAIEVEKELVISGIVCPETEPPRKIKQRKRGLRKKRDETKKSGPLCLCVNMETMNLHGRAFAHRSWNVFAFNGFITETQAEAFPQAW